jgi:MFS family permease
VDNERLCFVVDERCGVMSDGGIRATGGSSSSRDAKLLAHSSIIVVPSHHADSGGHDSTATATTTTTTSFELWRAVLLISSQSFVFGYAFSSINPCLALDSASDAHDCARTPHACPPGSLYNDVELSTVQISLCNAFLVVGGWVGAVISNFPSNRFGRRRTLLGNCVVVLVGGLLSCLRLHTHSTGSGSFSSMLVCLYVGRVVSGIGVGVISCVAPVLLNEIAANNQKGTITAMHQVEWFC